MVEGTAPAIRLRSLTKAFGTLKAVDDLDLDIQPGEFFSMLGPSGSGKTTVLHLIAGFEQPTSGTIELFGDDVTQRAPFDRDVNTVFQDYALFPHMNVVDNVAYGLRVRGIGRTARRKRALEALASVRLENFAMRKPSQLSGGQRQRVALARATVVEPKALLLDEPLGALDLKLRQGMQVELKEMQRELGITFIFVTHDQEEALTLSDRIAVFNEGRIEQLGTPQEIYEHPQSPFVADFVGTSNLFEADEAHRMLNLTGPQSLRPEKITLASSASGVPKGSISIGGRVSEVIYLGTSTRLLVDLDGGYRLNVLEQNVGGTETHDRRGATVVASWSPKDIVPLTPMNTEKRSTA